MGFPTDLLLNSEPDGADNPPILITEHEEMNDDIERPSTSRQHDTQPQTQPSTRPSTAQSSTHGQSLNSIALMAPRYSSSTTNGLSPSSSPTMPDFPHSGYHYDHRTSYDPHQQSHSYEPSPPTTASPITNAPQDLHPSSSQSQSQNPNGLPPSIQQPREVEPSPKRQRISRARSDSAPLGLGYSGWHVPSQGAVAFAAHGHVGRPRSGSNLSAVGPGMTSQVFLGRYNPNSIGTIVKSEDAQRG